MKKVAIGCGVVVIGFVAVLFWAFRSGGACQEEFYKAVLSGDPQQVMGLMDPEWRKEVDEPVLAEWMTAVKTCLGDFVKLSATSFSTSTRTVNGARITESKGTVEFEKGTAESALRYRNKKLVGFEVTSEQMKGWFKGLKDTGLYRERGKQFFTDLLSGKAQEAYGMMHEKLQENAPLEKLKAFSADLQKRFGALRSVSYESEEFEAGSVPKLKIVYKIVGEKKETTGFVRFEFAEVRGHLLAFKVYLAKSGEQQQEEFFAAVLSGDPTRVATLFHPALVAQIDGPVLAMWMNAVRSRLGQYVGVVDGEFSSTAKEEGGQAVLESKGTVKFEKGAVQSQLVSRGGRIVQFSVQSDLLKDWFVKPTDTSFYRDKAKQFLQYLITDKLEDASAMMHPNLRKSMPLDKLKAAMPAVIQRFGALKSLSYDSEKYTPGAIPRLELFYKLTCEKGPTPAVVGFQFAGMKAHLVSFNIPAKK